MSGLELDPGFTSNKPTHYPLDYGDFAFYQFLISRTQFNVGNIDIQVMV